MHPYATRPGRSCTFGVDPRGRGCPGPCVGLPLPLLRSVLRCGCGDSLPSLCVTEGCGASPSPSPTRGEGLTSVDRGRLCRRAHSGLFPPSARPSSCSLDRGIWGGSVRRAEGVKPRRKEVRKGMVWGVMAGPSFSFRGWLSPAALPLESVLMVTS